MEFQKLNQDHIDAVAGKSISRGIFQKMPPEYEFDFGLVHDGKVMGVGGINLLNLTTGFIWMDMSEDARDNIYTVYRCIKEYMDKIVHTHGLRRLECYVEKDFPEAIRTVRHLGFELEMECQQVIDEKSAFRYIKLYKEVSE